MMQPWANGKNHNFRPNLGAPIFFMGFISTTSRKTNEPNLKKITKNLIFAPFGPNLATIHPNFCVGFTSTIN